MKYSFVSVAFAAGSSALVARQNQQCVSLVAAGGVSGTVGQLGDGQNRVGGGHPAGCYCFGSDGGITDASGRGCILTAPTSQFQCDTGASPTAGFALGSGGSLTYNGNGKFYACPADTDEYNIYTRPVENQKKCVEITLSSGGSCGGGQGGGQSSGTGGGKSSVKPSATGSASAPGYSASTSCQEASTVTVTKTAQAAQATSTKTVQVTATTTQTNQVTVIQSYCSSQQPGNSQGGGYSTQSPPAQASSQSHGYNTQSPPAQASSQSGGYNTQPPPSQASPSSSNGVSSKPAPSKTSGATPSATGSSCPTDLSGNYQYPHLIIPASSASPDSAPGTSYFGTINSTTCSIYNFDIPQDYSGHTCTLEFLWPTQDKLQTSSFTTSGSGSLEFSKCDSPATQGTTYNNMPTCSSVGSVNASPGNGYAVTSGACAAGQTVTYKICSTGDFALRYFQDYNPSPIGLYVREC